MSPQHGRLRTIIVLDAVTAFTAAALMLPISLVWVSSPSLRALTAVVALSGVMMIAGLRPLGRGEVGRAVAWWAAANWSIAVVAAAGATFAWPLMMLAAMLPAMLATATASGRMLVAYVGISVAVCTAVVLLGVLQDLTDITAATPVVLQHAVLVLFTPALAAIIGLVMLQNSLRLQAALTEAMRAQGDLLEQAAELRRSRARVVAATDRERQRIERDLHDGAQQRLISIGIGLAAARAMCRTDPDLAVAEIDDLRGQLHVAHDEVRSLAQGVYPPVLTEHGLVEALRSAADRYPLPLTLDISEIGRQRPDLEASLYFCCLEALQNAAKHSHAEHVVLTLRQRADEIWFRVEDDGIGFDTSLRDHGLVHLHDRLGASGGEVSVTSSSRGTVVQGRLQLRDAPRS